MEKNQKVPGVMPFKRIGMPYPDEVKRKVVSEIQSDLFSQRAVERDYCINRKTDSWITRLSLIHLKSNTLIQKGIAKSNESAEVRLLSEQISGLQKTMDKRQLKIDGLETMIRVSEEELKIKIRKRLMTNGQKKHKSPTDRTEAYNNCCNEYTEMLQHVGIAISMTQNGNPTIMRWLSGSMVS